MQPRYVEMLEGFNICDVLMASGGYNYYGYAARNNRAWLIMRENTAQTEYRYAIGGLPEGYDAAWVAKASQVYAMPHQFSGR